jgi:hypothetical protein
VQTRELAARFDAYAEWRRRLSERVSRFHGWLDQHEFADAPSSERLRRAIARLADDTMVVAFVAEFSRGKSELINAIFFADFGARLLPSAAGRTTMCPTELLHDPSQPPSIRLLPIETRARDATVAEFRQYPDEWLTLPLDLASADRMAEALSRVADVQHVPIELARRYGFPDARDDGLPPATAEVEIPRWRHAIINFPHPLLKQGLVILDTPGLNAIGAEPELTLSLLPQAHAVLFLLAADAGVTKSDLEVWNRHLAGEDAAARGGRIVVLNKIDGLWDDLRRPADVDDEIARQVRGSAALLEVPEEQVHAVSAQKALLAKVNGDDALLARSRLPELEEALSRRLIPGKRQIVGAATMGEARAVAESAGSLLAARSSGIAGQLAELAALRGKNQDVVGHMLERVREEKAAFERGLVRFTALRNVFTEQTHALLDAIGVESLRAHATRTRDAIEAAPFTRGVRQAMGEFFAAIRGDFDAAARQSTEIHAMMRAMYARFAGEHQLAPFEPPPFPVLKYLKEIDRLERAYNEHFNTLWNMLSKAKLPLMRRFFDTVAARSRRVYDVANREADAWLRAVMGPLEGQVREHHLQLRKRLDSIRRIHEARDELEERIADLEQQDEALAAQRRALQREVAAIAAIAELPDGLPIAANA